MTEHATSFTGVRAARPARAALLAATISLLVPSAHGRADCTLRQSAAAAGVDVGAAVGPHLIDGDPEYGPVLTREFSSVTAENVMKWQPLQPTPGVYDFAGADQLVDFAENSGMAVRGHTLIWNQQLVDSTPDWVEAITDPTALRAAMADHITTVVTRYAGRVDAWDVVNEPLETGGSALYENHFFQVLGPGYIAEALELAHAADPDALLFINDVLVSLAGPKFDALLALVQDLLAAGAPLHGVGIQGHYLFPPDPVQLQANIAALAATGVIVEITELDILLGGGGTLDEKRQRQADYYFGVFSACLAVPGCQRVTTWGFTDRYTWIDSFIGPGLEPLLLDVDYDRKLAYFAVRDALQLAAGVSDRPLAGRKLKLIDSAAAVDDTKLVLRSRDGLVAPPPPGGAGDPRFAGATLRLLNPSSGEEAQLELPAEGWKGLGRPGGSSGYRFTDPGDGPCSRVVVQPGRLVARCTRGGIGFTLDEASQGTVSATLQLGCDSVQCVEFGGTVLADTGSAGSGTGRFVAKNAAAGAGCPTPY